MPEQIQKQKKPKNAGKALLLCKAFVFLYPLLLLFCLENLKPSGGFFDLILAQETISIGLKVFLLNYVFFLACSSSLYLATKNMFLTVVITAVFFLLFYLINYYRWLNTGLVFTPHDLAFSNHLYMLAPLATIKLDPKVILLVLAVVLCSIFAFSYRASFRELAAQVKHRFILIFLSVAFIVILIVTPFGNNAMVYFLDINSSTLQNYPENLYRQSGSFLGFVLLSKQPAIATSQQENVEYHFDRQALTKEYSNRRMEQVVREVDSILKSNRDNRSKTPIKPNVIVIMSEAFWDPSNIPETEFTIPPLPNYDSLSQTHQSGNMLSPVIGGKTSNVEYEFLTMNSNYFIDPNALPYEQPNDYIVPQDQRALPWQFKQNGYSTVAIHPYDPNFFNRAKLYPDLGFDQYISQDDMPDAIVKGEFISDDSFTDEMIRQIESAKDPLFLFGISMQNHYPYNIRRYNVRTIDVSSKTLKPLELAPIRTYTQGVHDADAALGKLVDYISSSNTPTILLFFGDHLPILGERGPLNAYYNAGYISSPMRSEWTIEDRSKMYSTPYLLWSNVDLNLESFEDISPLFAGPILMNAAGLEMNRYSLYLFESMKHFHGVNHQLYLNEDNCLYSEPLAEDQPWLENLFLINYDHFFHLKSGNNTAFSSQYFTEYN